MKKTIRFPKLILLIFFMIVPLFALSSLEVKEGRMRLVLDQSNGKFSAYYETNPGSGNYIPLFFDRDPRTSGFGFLAGNRIYSMGESSGFRLSSGKEAGGAYFLWESSSFSVRQSFRFIRSEGSALADGFSTTIAIKNVSTSDQTIGVHFLLDTYLGEDDSRHFLTDTGVVLRNETGYENMLPVYWVSPSREKNFSGLQGMVQGRGISAPDRIIFANWKRLQENIWNFNIQPSRNFNLLPYSINDSAVCYYFSPRRVSPGEQRELTFAFGAYNNGRFSVSQEGQASAVQDLYDQTLDSTTLLSDDPRILMREDLSSINNLIGKIDQLMENPESVTEEELNVLRQILSTLTQGKNRYDRR
jgi:hypothetical protein